LRSAWRHTPAISTQKPRTADVPPVRFFPDFTGTSWLREPEGRWEKEPMESGMKTHTSFLWMWRHFPACLRPWMRIPCGRPESRRRWNNSHCLWILSRRRRPGAGITGKPAPCWSRCFPLSMVPRCRYFPRLETPTSIWHGCGPWRRPTGRRPGHLRHSCV